VIPARTRIPPSRTCLAPTSFTGRGTICHSSRASGESVTRLTAPYFDSISYFCCSKGAVPTGPSPLAETAQVLGLGIQYEYRLTVSVYTISPGMNSASPNAAGSPTLTAPRALPGTRPRPGSTARIVPLVFHSPIPPPYHSTEPDRRHPTLGSHTVPTCSSRSLRRFDRPVETTRLRRVPRRSPARWRRTPAVMMLPDELTSRRSPRPSPGTTLLARFQTSV
jgi:hypothetical protein